MHNGGNREKRYKLNKGIIMNNFKKNIYKTAEEVILPPPSFMYSSLSGTQGCIGGYTDITGTTPITIYSSVIRPSWTIGTILYSDVYLTIPITATYIKSVTSGTIDLFFAELTSGIIDVIYPPMSPC